MEARRKCTKEETWQCLEEPTTLEITREGSSLISHLSGQSTFSLASYTFLFMTLEGLEWSKEGLAHKTTQLALLHKMWPVLQVGAENTRSMYTMYG